MLRCKAKTCEEKLCCNIAVSDKTTLLSATVDDEIIDDDHVSIHSNNSKTVATNSVVVNLDCNVEPVPVVTGDEKITVVSDVAC